MEGAPSSSASRATSGARPGNGSGNSSSAPSASCSSASSPRASSGTRCCSVPTTITRASSPAAADRASGSPAPAPESREPAPSSAAGSSGTVPAQSPRRSTASTSALGTAQQRSASRTTSRLAPFRSAAGCMHVSSVGLQAAGGAAQDLGDEQVKVDDGQDASLDLGFGRGVRQLRHATGPEVASRKCMHLARGVHRQRDDAFGNAGDQRPPARSGARQTGETERRGQIDYRDGSPAPSDDARHLRSRARDWQPDLGPQDFANDLRVQQDPSLVEPGGD